MDKSAMIRGAILAMNVENKIKTELFEYLDKLEEDANFLCCLQNAGVDNWGGYEYAQELMEESEEE